MYRHWAAVMSACIVGLIIVGPQLVFIAHMGSQYQGLPMIKTDAGPYYLSRLHDAYRGVVGNNPYIRTTEPLPAPNLTLSEPMLALPGILLNLPVPSLALAYTFIFPALIALVIYAIFYNFTRNRGYSIAALFAVMCGSATLNAHDLINLLRLQPTANLFAMYSQPIDPQFNSLCLFLFLYVLYRALTEQQKRWRMYAALLFGCLFYVYFYAATFALALCGVTFLLLLIRHDRRALQVAGLSLGGLLMGSYFFFNLYQVITNPAYPAYASGPLIRLTDTHQPVVSIVGVCTLMLFLWYFFYKKAKSEIDWFLLSLIITAFVVVNQQIITGKLLQQGHYHWYYNMPIFLMTLLYLAFENLKKYRSVYSHIFIGAIIIYSVCACLFIQNSSYIYWYETAADQQRYVPALTWLGKHGEDKAVIFANKEFSDLVPVFTFDTVVWDPQGGNYLLPPGRSDLTQERILAGNVEKGLRESETTYVVWDTKSDPSWHMDQYSFLTSLWEGNQLVLYRFD